MLQDEATWMKLVSEQETNLNERRTYESCTLQACFHLNWERGRELRMSGCCGSLPCQRRLLRISHHEKEMSMLIIDQGSLDAESHALIFSLSQ